MFRWFSVSLPELARFFRSGFVLVVALSGFSTTFAAQELPVAEVAPGVYVIEAELADSSPGNAGRVVNTGFVIGAEGVTVIDSGANHRHGLAILASIRTITSAPVRLVINTHPHPHNVLGNSAFAMQGIPVLATRATRDKMNERCPRCLQSLMDNVGQPAMLGTSIHLPEHIADAGSILESGGRHLKMLHFGHGHTEGDLAVLDVQSGTLFAGDLVYRGQIPHLGESDVRGWLSSLERLASEDYRVLVPGRGPIGTRRDIEPIRRYLSGVLETVGRAYAAGQTATEAIATATLPEFAAWQGYTDRHSRNVQHVYFEIERADLTGERQ